MTVQGIRLGDPHTWPHWPYLAVVRNDAGFVHGTLHAYAVGTVFFYILSSVPIEDMGRGLSRAARIEYGSWAAIEADGWHPA